MASERELQWLEDYLDHGDAKKAVEDNFNCQPKSVASKASQLKKRFAEEIHKRVQESFSMHSMEMRNVIKDLALNSDQDSVKLKAAQDWLDRGGFKPVEQYEDLGKEATEAELMERLKLLVQGFDPQVLEEIFASAEDTRYMLMTALSQTQGEA